MAPNIELTQLSNSESLDIQGGLLLKTIFTNTYNPSGVENFVPVFSIDIGTLRVPFLIISRYLFQN
jgi:hypothetical protein